MVIDLVARLIRRLRPEPTRITLDREPYGPFLPWQEELARNAAKVPPPGARPVYSQPVPSDGAEV